MDHVQSSFDSVTHCVCLGGMVGVQHAGLCVWFGLGNTPTFSAKQNNSMIVNKFAACCVPILTIFTSDKEVTFLCLFLTVNRITQTFVHIFL